MNARTTPARRRATLRDVAERAGVTVSTVSKVLNRRAGFSPETADRVLIAVQELAYVPITRGHAVTASGAIVAVFDTLYTLYSLRLLEGLVGGAQDAGYELITQVTDADHAGGSILPLDGPRIAAMAAKGHAGVILVTSAIDSQTLAHFAEHALPLVTIDAPTPLDESVIGVGSDHWGGGRQAAEHLLGLGHRRLATVGGDRTNPGLRERYSGFREAVETAGLTLDRSLVSDAGIGSGYAAVARMLAAADPPTAVFASTDYDALEAIRAATAAGLRVPEDLSVVGYDDTYAQLPPVPTLTTVHAPLESIGRVAVETVQRLAADREPLSSRLQLATRLIVRGTTSPPRAG